MERPDPAPGAGEVLIRVAAAGVNRPDVMQRRGMYPPPPGASDIPGLEVAGTIAQVGAGVTSWKEGDAVCALVAGGGYASQCVAPAPQCLPIPARARRHHGCGDPGNVLHRVDQRVRPRASSGRRGGAVSRRVGRHRHDGDSTGVGARVACLCHRRLGREMPRLRSARRRARDQLPDDGLCRGDRLGDRAVVASISFSTSWAAPTRPGTSHRWPSMGASCRSACRVATRQSPWISGG